jgi:hypothetical protein
VVRVSLVQWSKFVNVCKKISTINVRHYIIILVDLIVDCAKNQDVANLFSKCSHHKIFSIVYINQNMCCQGINARTITFNCHYIILFQNFRDQSQVEDLLRKHPEGNYTTRTPRQMDFIYLIKNNLFESTLGTLKQTLLVFH